MTVLGKIRHSIARRNGHVVLRSELARFGGQSQLTAALGRLIKDGELVRMAPGIFVRANPGPNGRYEWTLANSRVVFQEAFDKLHIAVTFLGTEQRDGRYNCIVDTGVIRFSRPLQLGKYSVAYSQNESRQNAETMQVPADLDQLPKRNVGEYIFSIAKCNKVDVNRRPLDDWAEALTRASGDSVQLDKVGQTLVVLFKAHLVNGRQMARLMTNYMLEKKGADRQPAETASLPADKEYSLS